MGKRTRWRRLRRKPRRRDIPRSTVHFLDHYAPGEIRHLRRHADDLLAFHYRYFSELQHQRSQKADEIRGALLKASTGPIQMQGWFRVVSFKRSLMPLSWMGSLVEPGGRFNIPEMDSSKFVAFPALYLAEELETALLEKFGQDAPPGNPFTKLDFALRDANSFSGVKCRWMVEKLIDLRNKSALQDFVSIIAAFRLPPWLEGEAKRLNTQVDLIRNVDTLVQAISFEYWRGWQMQFDVPAPSQVFGQLVYDAGIEGIVYPSKFDGKLCVALFPFKFEDSGAFVEVEDPVPEGAACRIDRTNCRLMGSSWPRPASALS